MSGISFGKRYSGQGIGPGGNPPERPVETPFGENITTPDSTVIPPKFHGAWSRKSDDQSPSEIVEAERLILGGSAERVVAVRFIDASSIAVVTRSEDAGGEYALHYRGLSEDGARLTDLENMDWVLQRCPA